MNGPEANRDPRPAESGGQETPASGDNAGFSAASQMPSINLPKGGGAIRGIGEKFAANPVTGTGSMTVPIATSPGRSGLGPELALSYDSGAGNGAFGFGWSLSLPSITRKTDKGLPQYLDAEELDVFILSVVRRSGRYTTSERGAESETPHLRGISDESGRLMVLMSHNTDIADGWERENEDWEFFERFSFPAYAVGINVVLYEMSH